MTTTEALIRAGKRHNDNPVQLARIAFAARCLDPSLEAPRQWLPIALARLGDAEGARTLCEELVRGARNGHSKRAAAATLTKVAAALAEAPSEAAVSLADLERAGHELVREVVALVTPRATGLKIPCPKCNGEGDIAEYVHIAAGLCFLCYGRRTIREYAAAL
jgi:hypothetical protein